MKRIFFLALGLLMYPLVLAEAEVVKLDAKLQKYHLILLKRPESANLFQRFQTSWLSQRDEASLGRFLESRATDGKVADKQIYAYFLLQQGKEIEAVNMFTKALDLEPKNKQVYLDRAKTYSKLLDFDKAVEDLDKAINFAAQDDPFLLAANKLKGRYLTRQGRADEAVKHWLNLAKNNSQDQELIEDVIDILTSDGLFEPALEHAKLLCENTLDPYKKALRTLRVGDIMQKRGERDAAIKIYKDTLGLSGAGSWLEREIIAQIETIYRREENLLGLRDQLKGLSEKFTQRLEITQKYADVLSESGEHKKARDLYYGMIKRSPDDEDLKKSLLQILDRAKDYKAAKIVLNNLVKLSPEDSDLHIQLAKVCEQLGDKKSVLDNLEQYSQKVFKGAATAIRYASLLDKYGFKEEALEAYRKAQKVYKDEEDTQFTVANYFFLNEKKVEAEAIWGEIAKLESERAISRLLEVLLFNGKPELGHEIVKQQKEKRRLQKEFVKIAVKVAESVKDAPLAIELAKLSLKLADKPVDVDSAIQHMTQVVVKFKQVTPVLRNLRKKASLEIREKFLLARLLEESGDTLKANELVKELSLSNNIAALQQVVRIYNRKFELDKAAASLEKILKLPGGLKSIYLKQLQQIYSRDGKIEMALATIKRWKSLTPNDKQAWLAEVEMLELVEGSAAALKSLRKGVERFEGNVEIYGKLAGLYTAEKQFSRAKQIYWRLYEESKDISERMGWAQQLSLICEKDGSVSELIDSLNERKRNSPKSIAPIMALAEVYRNQNQGEERRNLLLEATRLRPDDSALFIEIANSDLRSGQIEKAKQALLKAQKVDKTDRSTSMLARIYMDEGEFEKGISELERMVATKKDARSIEAVCLSLMNEHAFDEVDSLLKRNITEHSEDWRLKVISAINDYELGYINRSISKWVELLAVEQEIPGLASGWKIEDYISRSFRNSSMDMSKMPRIHKELMVAKRIGDLSQALTGGGGNQNYYFARNAFISRNAGISSLPRRLAGLRIISRLQFIRLLDDIELKQREEWITRAKDAGFSKFGVWETLLNADPSGNRQGRHSFKEEVLLENLDEKIFLEQYLIARLEQVNFSVNARVWKALERYRKNPSEFLSPYLPYFHLESWDKKKVTANILAQVPSDSEVPEVAVIALFTTTEKTLNRKAADRMPPEVVDVFRRYIKETKAKGTVAKPNFSSGSASLKSNLILWSEMFLIMDVLNGDDYSPIVKIIEENDLGGWFYRQRWRWQQQGQNGRLLFPPQGLDQVTESQISILKPSESNGYNAAKVDPKKLAKYVSEFKNPVLKVLATWFCDSKADLTKLIEEAKKDVKYMPDAELLAAAYLHQDPQFKNLKTLISLLESSRVTSVSKIQRGQVDSYLAFIPLDAKYSGEFVKLDPEHQSYSKSAARRLMMGGTITDSDVIQRLIAGLGMQSEERRFLTKNKKSIRRARKPSGGLVGGGFRNPSYNSSTSVNPSQPHEKVALLYKDKKTDAANRMVSRQLRIQLKQSPDYEFYIKKLVKEVTQVNETQSVLALMHPKQSVSPRKWIDFYKIAKAFENEEAMKEGIDFLSKLHTIPQSVKVSLALALYDQDRLRSLKLLENSRDHQRVLYGLEHRLKEEKKSVKNYVNTLEFIADYLDTLAKQGNYGSQRTLGLFRNVARASGLSDDRYGYAELPKQDKKLVGRAAAAGERIFLYALKNRDAAEQAFEYLYEKHKVAKTLDKLVAPTVASIMETRLDGSNSYTHYSFSSGMDGRYRQRKIDRMRFLAMQMYAEKNSDLISDKQIKAIKGNVSTITPFLVTAREVINLPDEEFLKKLQAVTVNNDMSVIVNWAFIVSVRGNLEHKRVHAKKFIEHLMTLAKKPDDNGHILIAPESSKRIEEVLEDSVNFLIESGNTKEIVDYLNTLSGIQNPGKKTKEAMTDGWLKPSKLGVGSNGLDARMLYRALYSVAALNPLSCREIVKVGNAHGYPFTDINFVFEIDADKWFKAIEKSGFLVSIDKFEPEPLVIFSEDILAKARLLKGRKNRGDKLIDMPRSDFELLCRSLDKSSKYFGNRSQIEIVLKKLRAVKGEKRYAARLGAHLIEHGRREAFSFFKDYAATIQEAPERHKMFLIDLFRINEDLQVRAMVERAGILRHLPYDKKMVEEEGNKKLKNFLDLKIPLDRDLFYNFEKNAVDMVVGNLATDVEMCKKILDKYIAIIEGSPLLEGRFTTSHRAVTTLQFALAENFFEKIKDAKVYPKDSLKLIYHLAKREDHHKFNIGLQLQHTMPANWHLQHGIAKNIKQTKTVILKEYAKIYSELKDEDLKYFYKTAWFVYFASYEHFKKLHFNLFSYSKFVDSLKNGNRQYDEFLDWVKICSYFENESLNRVIHWKDWIKHHDIFKFQNRIVTQYRSGILARNLKDFPLYYRMLAIHALSQYDGTIDVIALSPELLKFVIDTYIESIEFKEEYAWCSDNRFVLQIRKYLHKAEAQDLEKLSDATYEALKVSLKHMEKGGSMHRHQFENLFAIMVKHEKGKERAVQLIKNHPDRFEGVISVAHYLVGEGLLDEAFMIISPKNVANLIGGYYRMSWNSGHEKYLPQFLNKFSSKMDKAKVYAHFLIFESGSIYGAKTQTLSQRTANLAQLIMDADPDFKNQKLMAFAYTTLFDKLDNRSSKMMTKYFEDRVIQIGPKSFLEVLNKDNYTRFSYEQRFLLRNSIKWAMLTGNEKIVESHIKSASDIVRKQKAKINFNATQYADDVIRAVLSTFCELYGTGEEDELLKKLAPIYRSACSLQLDCQYSGRKIGRSKWTPAKHAELLSPLIHKELNLFGDYQVWEQKLPQKRRAAIKSRDWNHPLRFAHNLLFQGSFGIKSSMRDNKGLIVRILNNEAYQRQVVTVQDSGSGLDYMMDFQLINWEHALELLEGGEVMVKVPQFAAAMARDKAQGYALTGDYEKMATSLEEMKVLLAKKPLANKVANVLYHIKGADMLSRVKKMEQAREFVPEEIMKNYPKKVKREVEALKARLEPKKKS